MVRQPSSGGWLESWPKREQRLVVAWDARKGRNLGHQGAYGVCAAVFGSEIHGGGHWGPVWNINKLCSAKSAIFET